jgi:hypothetical protein
MRHFTPCKRPGMTKIGTTNKGPYMTIMSFEKFKTRDPIRYSKMI